MLLFSTNISIPNSTSCYQTELMNHISSFFNIHEHLKVNLVGCSTKIKEEIIIPLEEFHQTLSSDYQAILGNLQNIILSLSSHEETLSNLKLQYYEECKNTQAMEEESLKIINDSNNASDTSKIEEIHKKLTEQRKITDIKSLLYQKEIAVINKLFGEYEADFSNIMIAVSNTEEGRLLFIKTIFDKYIKIMEGFSASFTNDRNKLNEALYSYNQLNDLTSYNDSFNNLSNTSKTTLFKWEKLKFETYETYKANLEKEKKENIIHINQIEKEQNQINNQYPNLFLYPERTASQMSESDETSNTFEIVSKPDDNKAEREIREMISKFVSSLFQKESLFPDILTSVIELIDNNNSVLFYKILLEIYIKHTKANRFYKFLNFTNLTHLTNLLKNIISNLDFSKEVKQYSYNILSTILTIGEKSYYESTFMCSLLSQNTIFKDRKLWYELIEYEIVSLLNIECSKLKKINDKDKSIKNGAIIQSLSNFFKGTGKTMILETTKISSEIANYKQLKFEQKEKLNTIIAKNVIHSVIKKYIIHMSNYNYEMGNAHDIVMDICTKYKLKNQSVNFYVLYLNTSFYTTRKYIPNIKDSFNQRSSDYLQKLDVVAKNQKTNTFILKYPCQMITNNEKLIVLENVFKYLPDRYKLDVMHLDKELSNKLSKKIYKYMLKTTKNNFEKHLKIWKSILRCHDISQKYPYVNILERCSKVEEKKNNIIDLDVKRTTLKDNQEEGRAAITRILKAFVFIEEKLDYCQGMNYIAAFLYQITQFKEDEAFYLLLGLSKNSNFKDIFIDDMQKLKIFFYILRRLIFLYMPELISYFNSNSVNVRYFASPWMITLFTNFYQYHDGYDSKILVQIWDDFLLHGWKSIFSSILALIKYNYDKLLNLKGDELLTFLINDLSKSAILKNENYEIFEKYKNSYKLKDSIINNLEEEIDLEAAIYKVNFSLLIDKADEEN